MNHTIDTFPRNNDGVTVPRLWVTVALSILLHILALWGLPQPLMQKPEFGEDRNLSIPLSLLLVPPAPPAPVVIPVPPQPAPKPARVQRPRTTQRPPPVPPVIALDKPAPDSPPTAPVPAARPAPPPADGDFAAYIEARRRARGAPEPAPPAEDDNARRERIIAGNLATQRNLTFGYDPDQGGGVFQIQSLSYDYAEFVFFGWNRDIRRNTKQLIEVRRGDNSDIRIAVVRRMVAIIREYEQEDFLWVSQRLRRSVTLSARPRDRAGLEDFMMREFFPAPVPAQR